MNPPAVAPRIHFATLGSTNAEALERAGGGHECWVTADVQTEGRGRRGRDWVSPKGNLHASALLLDREQSWDRSGLPLVAGIALLEAVCSLAPAMRNLLALKWPNDLLLEGRKVAGILIEALDVDGGTAFACGFGVNCRSTPDLPATARLDMDRDDLFGALAYSFARERETWAGGAGMNAIRDRWIHRAGGLGRPIIVRLPNRTVTGTFEDLDHAGHLLLRHSDGRREPIAAGDVFFKPERT